MTSIIGERARRAAPWRNCPIHIVSYSRRLKFSAITGCSRGPVNQLGAQS